MRGKDRWETRYKTRLWWHDNREWVSLIGWIGGVALLMVLILTLVN
ncbi:MAG TPA: hypothetical protein VGH10_13945 [Actinomycetota bacterium]|jgi:hypothetical protein